jgi:hypothetical protein
MDLLFLCFSALLCSALLCTADSHPSEASGPAFTAQGQSHVIAYFEILEFVKAVGRSLLLLCSLRW